MLNRKSQLNRYWGWFVIGALFFLLIFMPSETESSLYVNQTDGFSTTDSSCGYPEGITTNGTDFWILDGTDDFVYHFDKDGNNITDGFHILDAGASAGAGITTNGTDFWVSSSPHNFVYHFDMNGNNITDGFDISENTNFAFGITSNLTLSGDPNSFPHEFWVTDAGDEFVYHYLDTDSLYPSPPSDSCTYGGSGDWEMTWDDNCTITSAVAGDDSNFILEGCGDLTLEADVSGFSNYKFIPNRLGHECFIYQIGGYFIQD